MRERERERKREGERDRQRDINLLRLINLRYFFMYGDYDCLVDKVDFNKKLSTQFCRTYSLENSLW